MEMAGGVLGSIDGGDGMNISIAWIPNRAPRSEEVEEREKDGNERLGSGIGTQIWVTTKKSRCVNLLSRRRLH